MYGERKTLRSGRTPSGEQAIPLRIFKEKYAQILREVERSGEPVTLTRRGRAVVRITPCVLRPGNTFIGSAEGTVVFSSTPQLATGHDAAALQTPLLIDEADRRFGPPAKPLLLGKATKKTSKRKGIRVGR